MACIIHGQRWRKGCRRTTRRLEDSLTNADRGGRFLVLQHIGCEPAAIYGDVLLERGMEVEPVMVNEGEALPDWRGFDGILVMGGPMGAYDEDLYPWLGEEKRFIAEAVRAGTPFWGACLGAQLLAAALGARVYPGEAPEVGVLPVSLVGPAIDDPVFSVAPPRFMTLQWHGDTFDLPPGATLLASSEAYPHQAFAWHRAYGLQFHLEVTPDLAAQWAEVPAYASSLERILGPGALPRLIGDVEARAWETGNLARALFGRWLVEVLDGRDGDAGAAANANRGKEL